MLRSEINVLSFAVGSSAVTVMTSSVVTSLTQDAPVESGSGNMMSILATGEASVPEAASDPAPKISECLLFSGDHPKSGKAVKMGMFSEFEVLVEVVPKNRK